MLRTPIYLRSLAILFALSLTVGCGGGGNSASGDTQDPPDHTQPPSGDGQSPPGDTSPVASFSADDFVLVGNVAKIDASASYDPNGNSIIYFWEMVSKPEGSLASLEDAGEVASFSADIPGRYEIHLFVSDGTLDSDVVEINVLSVTPLSGILSDDLLLTQEESPYLITDKVQVAYGATLRLESGVVVMGEGRELVVYGELVADGTDTVPVQMEDVRIVPGSNTSSDPWRIEIHHTQVNGGSLMYPTGNSGHGGLVLKDSVVRDIPYMYIWYPVSETLIERNIFTGTGGISAGHRVPRVVVRNNLFVDYMGDHGTKYAITNWAAYGEPMLVELNTFLDVGEVAVRLPSGYDSTAIYAANNYWGTTDLSVINSMVYDRNVDLGTAGYIDYNPILMEPHSGTPSAP